MSNLSDITYPYLFPSPPSPEDATGHLTSTARPENGSPQASEVLALHEQSWFYYLSEISLLRLSGRINDMFYCSDHRSWMKMNLTDMVNAVHDFELQLQQWYVSHQTYLESDNNHFSRRDSLPSVISCFDKPPESNSISELELNTWARYSSLQYRLYRPFIYRLAHSQSQDWPFRALLHTYAEKAVRNALDPLCTIGLGHRHAGAWYKCREAAGRSLVLIASMKIGLVEQMGQTDECNARLDLFVSHLRLWEKESLDLQLARQAVERMRGHESP